MFFVQSPIFIAGAGLNPRPRICGVPCRSGSKAKIDQLLAEMAANYPRKFVVVSTA